MKGGTKGNKEKKQNRKKQRISKTGLLKIPPKNLQICRKITFLGLLQNKRTKLRERNKTTRNPSPPKKHLFACWQTTLQFLVNSAFFNLRSFISAKLCFSENSIKIVFSAEHSFCLSQIVKPPFEAPSQSGMFATHSAIWGFSPCA